MNMAGCDSVITYNVTIDSSSFSSIIDSACFEYQTPSGKWLYNSGVYNDTLQNVQACDSILTINLTIKTVNSSISQVGQVLRVDSFASTYQWIDCDNNTSIAGATFQSFNPTSNGSYAAVIEQNGCSDTTDCFAYNSNGIDLYGLENVILQPNPSEGNVTLKNLPRDLNLQINLYSSQGQLIKKSISAYLEAFQFDFNLSSGFYIINLSSPEYSRNMNLVVR
jgi:hypothetical protein